MQQIRLGANGPSVSVIGFGAMSFTGVYGTSDDGQDQAILARALELGINLIDTANIYGDSEEIIGRFLPARRAEVVLATKFGSGGEGLGKHERARPFLEQSMARL